LDAQILGAGVIWNGNRLEPPVIPVKEPVIPAKAGIQPVDSALPKVCWVDSRFRGNDCGLERPCLANDSTTRHLGTVSSVLYSAVGSPSFTNRFAWRAGLDRALAHRPLFLAGPCISSWQQGLHLGEEGSW